MTLLKRIRESPQSRLHRLARETGKIVAIGGTSAVFFGAGLLTLSEALLVPVYRVGPLVVGPGGTMVHAPASTFTIISSLTVETLVTVLLALVPIFMSMKGAASVAHRTSRLIGGDTDV